MGRRAGGRPLALSTAIIATLAAAAPAWGATPAAQSAPELRAPHLRPDPTTSEAGLWGLSDRAEAHVKSSADLDPDPALNAYVRSVVCKIASEYCEDLRVYVLDRPVFNASAAPNGYVEVNSGLLLRSQTEDDLAFVLGHEVSHFGRNHTLAQLRAAKTTANVTMILQIGVAAVAAGAMYSAASSGAYNSGNYDQFHFPGGPIVERPDLPGRCRLVLRLQSRSGVRGRPAGIRESRGGPVIAEAPVPTCGRVSWPRPRPPTSRRPARANPAPACLIPTRCRRTGLQL